MILSMLQSPLHFIFGAISNVYQDSLLKANGGDYSLISDQVRSFDYLLNSLGIFFALVIFGILIGFIIKDVIKSKNELEKYSTLRNYEISFSVSFMNLFASIFYIIPWILHGTSYLGGLIFGYAIFSFIKIIFAKKLKINHLLFNSYTPLFTKFLNIINAIAIIVLTIDLILSLCFGFTSAIMDMYVINLVIFIGLSLVYVLLGVLALIQNESNNTSKKEQV